MVQLLIVADDFTGALDTGVHFSEKGIRTKVMVQNEETIHLEQECRSDTEVLVIDAETRHMIPEEAYGRVYRIVAEAVSLGVQYIYKKTDSALRGNIGAELTAVYEAAYGKVEADALYFVPALPQMNRITKKGLHYIDGIPVSSSVFGKDPFEPVQRDSVKEIIGLQSSIEVHEISDAEDLRGESTGIWIVDAEKDCDIKKIGFILKDKGKCHLLAGCAGFAEVLVDMIGLECREGQETQLEDKLFVVCGSVNPITKQQLEYAEDQGFPRIRLCFDEKLNQNTWMDGYGTMLIKELIRINQMYDCAVLDTNDSVTSIGTLEYAKEKGMTISQVREGISETLGIIMKKLLDQGLHAVFLVTGGDTLLGLMKEIRKWELNPVREISPGCVLTVLEYQGKQYYMITKSGGFGHRELIIDISRQLKIKRKGSE